MLDPVRLKRRFLKHDMGVYPEIWALVSELGFLNFQISRFSIFEIYIIFDFLFHIFGF